MILNSFLLLIFFTVSANAQNSDRVQSELQKFTSVSGETLPLSYMQSVSNRVIALAIESEQVLMKTANPCFNKTEVSFDHNLTLSNNLAITDFESGLVKIETTYCFPALRSDLLIRKSNDPNFRSRAFSTIKNTYARDGFYCEITSAPTIGASNYCYQLNLNLEENYSTSQSFNVWNDSVDRYDSPVYFRYVFESARRLEQGTIYHVISYVRASKLNSIQKFFSKSFISATQDKVLLKLTEELK